MGEKKQTKQKILPQTTRVTCSIPNLNVIFTSIVIVTVTLTFQKWEIHIQRLLGGPHYVTTSFPQIGCFLTFPHTGGYCSPTVITPLLLPPPLLSLPPPQLPPPSLALTWAAISKPYYLWTSQVFQNCSKYDLSCRWGLGRYSGEDGCLSPNKSHGEFKEALWSLSLCYLIHCGHDSTKISKLSETKGRFYNSPPFSLTHWKMPLKVHQGHRKIRA